MEYSYEQEIKCPHCGYEEQDSWEFGEDSGTWNCESCGEEFLVERHISVTYSSKPINS